MKETLPLSTSIREIYNNLYEVAHNDESYGSKIQPFHLGMETFYKYLENIEQKDQFSESEVILLQDAEEFLKALKLIEVLKNQMEKLELAPFLEIWLKIQSQSARDILTLLFNVALRANTSLQAVIGVNFEDKNEVLEKFSGFLVYLAKKRESIEFEVQQNETQTFLNEFINTFKKLDLDEAVVFNNLDVEGKKGLFPKEGVESLKKVFPFFKEMQKRDDLQKEMEFVTALSRYDEEAYIKQLEILQGMFLKAIERNKPDLFKSNIQGCSM